MSGVATEQIDCVVCEDGRSLRVALSAAPALYGPRSLLRRAAWTVTTTTGEGRRLGVPAVADDDPTHVILPFDVPWLAGDTVSVSVDGESAAGADFDTAPVSCRAIPEVSPASPTAAGSLPRDDLATDPATGGLVIAGGTWAHHWGADQLRKVLARLLTDRPPAGLGIRKGSVPSSDDLARYRARAREIVRAQTGVEASQVSVAWERETGILRVSVSVRTPDGWKTTDVEV